MSEHESEPEPAQLEPSEERRLADLLRNACAPQGIDPARHEQLLLSALEDPFAAPSAEELIESERLRQALDGQGDHESLILARALAAAFLPAKAAPLSVPDLVQQPTAPSATKPGAIARDRNVVRLRFAGGGAALAAAAAVWLALSAGPRAEPAADLPTLALAQSRSTAALFQNEAGDAASSRIDRIASARSRELRDNRYALWGVR